MKEYIEREAFLVEKRKQYCADCDRRKGMKRGNLVVCYEIGEAPCRACSVDDMLNDVEDFPAADVVERKHGTWEGQDIETIFISNRCSSCGALAPVGHYCYRCGAKMDGGADDDDN